MSGLRKLTAVANKLQAWQDWNVLCEQARSRGQGHLIEGLEPPEGAGWRTIDKAAARLRRVMANDRDAVMPQDRRRGRSVLFKS